MKALSFLFVVSFLVANLSCKQNTETKDASPVVEISEVQNKQDCIDKMQLHLNAVSNKDLQTLAATLSPYGNMQLILPQTEIINGVDGFMDYHREWFEIPNWTFETKILNAAVGETHGFVIVEVVYREPERNGKPYFNRMTVSYDLNKLDKIWYVVKDHASSVEKSTDTE